MTAIQTSWFRKPAAKCRLKLLINDSILLTCNGLTRETSPIMNQILVPGVVMTVLRCAHACPVQTASIQRAQACRLRGVRPFTGPGHGCRQLIRSAAPAASGQAAETVTQEGPRCYLEPTGDGEGLVEICLTEGKLDIGIADSDYYFTAFTGSLQRFQVLFCRDACAKGATYAY